MNGWLDTKNWAALITAGGKGPYYLASLATLVICAVAYILSPALGGIEKIIFGALTIAAVFSLALVGFLISTRNSADKEFQRGLDLWVQRLSDDMFSTNDGLIANEPNENVKAELWASLLASIWEPEGADDTVMRLRQKMAIRILGRLRMRGNIASVVEEMLAQNDIVIDRKQR